MPYFRELPNIQYSSLINGNGSIDDFSTVKNLFKRPKIREDILNYVTSFDYYQIEGDERPDQIAEKLYNDSGLDWIILLTNNIINVHEEWPLNNNDLYHYMINKYGSDDELSKIHHYETIEYRDKYGRIVMNGGLQVDDSSVETIETTTDSNSYFVNSFPSPKANTIVKVNLNQKIKIYGRDIRESEYNITNIQTNISYLEIPSHENKNNLIEVTILNNLDPWPSGWGGSLNIYLRDGSFFTINIDDVILDNTVRIPARLFEFTGTIVDGILKPTFNFTNEVTTAG